MSVEAFNALSPAALKALAGSFKQGVLSVGLAPHALQQIAGSRAGQVAEAIAHLQAQGFSPDQIGTLVGAVAETRERIPDPSLVFELVLTGPAVTNVPTQDTSAVVRALFSEAEREVLVVGYAVWNGAEIFQPLHDRMIAWPGLDVIVCLDIPRRPPEANAAHIVSAFANDFEAKHWPWPEKPRLYFYPRSLEDAPTERGSLHAKSVVVDQRVAFVTSANFTEAAQRRNIEVGVLTRYGPMVERIRAYFTGLIESGRLRAVKVA